jgi:hypothetical protein
MGRHPVRLPREDRGLLEIDSHARTPALRRDRLSPDQIAQVARTVRRTPEVMVKVTGGGTSIRAGSANLAYITRHSDLELHSDDGSVASDRETQRALTKHWHLDLSSRQGGSRGGSDKPGRAYKLVQNIVLSMPHPTPPEKALAAAKVFAREKFGLQHRYAMALHTDQRHPHVHLGRQGGRLRRSASPHRQTHATNLEWGFRQDDARARSGSQCYTSGTARPQQGPYPDGHSSSAAPEGLLFRTQSHQRHREGTERDRSSVRSGPRAARRDAQDAACAMRAGGPNSRRPGRN